MAKIGFIGTGIMGQPMAANLQKAGHQLFLSEHHGKAPAELINAGAVALANPQQVAGTQVNEVVVRDELLALGAFASTRRAEEDNVEHEQKTVMSKQEPRWVPAS